MKTILALLLLASAQVAFTAESFPIKEEYIKAHTISSDVIFQLQWNPAKNDYDILQLSSVAPDISKIPFKVPARSWKSAVEMSFSEKRVPESVFGFYKYDTKKDRYIGGMFFSSPDSMHKQKGLSSNEIAEIISKNKK